MIVQHMGPSLPVAAQGGVTPATLRTRCPRGDIATRMVAASARDRLGMWLLEMAGTIVKCRVSCLASADDALAAATILTEDGQISGWRLWYCRGDEARWVTGVWRVMRQDAERLETNILARLKEDGCRVTRVDWRGGPRLIYRK